MPRFFSQLGRRLLRLQDFSWGVPMLAAMVLLVGLAVTGVVSYRFYLLAQQERQASLERLASRVELEIQHRFQLAVAGLKSAQGLLAASDRVSRQEFRQFIGVRNMRTEFPGVRGIGFIERVKRSQLAVFLAAEQADQAPDFVVRSTGHAADLFVIKLIEPLARNQSAWGYDIGSEPLRRGAAEQAMRTGAPTLTARITLVQDKQQGPGFLYLLPIYAGGVDPKVTAAREEFLMGWVYAPIVVAEMLSELSDAADQFLDIALFDGPDLQESNLLYHSQPDSGAAATWAEPNAMARHFEVGGRTLTLAFSPTPLFANQFDPYSSVRLGLGGVFLNLLLALLVWSLGNSRKRAMQMAQDMTADWQAAQVLADAALRANQALLSTIHQHALVSVADRTGLIREVNEAFCQISGFSRDALLGQSYRILNAGVHPAEFWQEMWQTISAGKSWRGQVCNRAKDGGLYWLDSLIAPFLGENGQVERFVSIHFDITESRQAKQELASERQRLFNILEATNTGTWEWHVQTGATRFNERWAEIIGYTLEELAPINIDTWLQLCHPDDRVRSGELLQRHFSGELDYYECEVRMRHRDGHWVWVLDRGRVIARTPDGQPQWIAGTHTDISASKRVEQELRRDRNLFIGGPVVVFSWTLEAGWPVRYASANVETVLGYPLEQLLDECFSWMIHPDDLPRVGQELERYLAIKASTWEQYYRIRHHNGEYRYFYDFSMVLHDDLGKVVGVRGYLLDQTAQKQAEQARQEMESRYRTVVEALVEGVVLQSASGEIVASNQMAEDILGLSREQLQGRTSLDPDWHAVRVDGQDFPGCEHPAMVALRTGVAQRNVIMGIDHPRKGKRVWINVNALPIIDPVQKTAQSVVCSFEDISDRREAEAALRQTTSLLTRVLDAATEVSIIATDVNGVIAVFNRGAESLLAYRAEEVVGQQTPLIVHDPNEVAARGAVLSAELSREITGFAVLVARAELGESEEREWTYVRKDGSRFTVSLIVSAMRREDGAIQGYLCIGHDVTRAKQYEAQLQMARQKAEMASVAKSAFLANMSHEIRTPMNGVLGMTAVLLDSELGDEQRRSAEIIRSSAESLLGVINDILDFSKIEAGKLDIETLDFNLPTLLDDFSAVLAFKADEKHLEFVCSLAADVPVWVRGDPGRLRQILTNLVGNAIKFTEQGGVSIRVERVSQSGDEVGLRFAVRDTGIGIARAKQGELFQSFSQLDASTTRKYGGTGLGLAISRQLVELMGGGVGVESEEGHGSTFWFTVLLGLPLQPSQAPVLAADLHDERVLLVDEHALNRETLLRQLEAWGMRAVAAENGAVALQLLREAAAVGQPYRLVILDTQMPDMDGVQLGAMIRQDMALAKTSLILMGGIPQCDDSRRFADLGFAACLPKPVSQSELLDCLATALVRKDRPSPMVARPVARACLPSLVFQARILLAEDNPINQKVAQAMLAKLGVAVVTVNNGQEALAALAVQDFDLVLMDMQMPEMDGLEATRQIRNPDSGVRRHDIPVIALTANAMLEDQLQCQAAGMDGHLAKPLSAPALADALRHWLAPQG